MSNINNKQINLISSRIPFGSSTDKFTTDSSFTFSSSLQTLSVNYIQLPSSLRSTPTNNLLESDGSRPNFTVLGNRKKLAFTDDTKTTPEIFYSVNKSDTVFSTQEAFGHTLATRQLAPLETVSGSVSVNTFTRTTGTWTAGALTGYKVVLRQGTSLHLPKEIIYNTTTTLYFKDDISFNAYNTVDIYDDLMYINDALVDSSTIIPLEIFCDGVYIYVITSTAIYKIDKINLSVKKITNGFTCRGACYIGDSFILLPANGLQNLRKFNLTNEKFTTLTSLVGVDTSIKAPMVYNGLFLYVTDTSGNVHKYDLIALTKTTYSNLVPAGLRMSMFRSSDTSLDFFIQQTNNSGNAVNTYKFSVATNTVVLVLNSSVVNYASGFDGYYNYQLDNSDTLRKININDGFSTISDITYTTNVTSRSQFVYDGKNLIRYANDGSNFGFSYVNLSSKRQYFLKSFLYLSNPDTMNLILVDNILYLFVDRSGTMIYKFQNNNSGHKQNVVNTSKFGTIINSLSVNLKPDLYTTEYVSIDESIISVDTTSTAKTRILPDVSKCKGQIFKIKDIGNNALTNNITIQTISGNIDGSSSYIINTNRGAIEVYSDGVNYHILSKIV